MRMSERLIVGGGGETAIGFRPESCRIELDRRDPRDRLVGERPTERHRAGEPAVEKHRAAAHAPGHAALLQPLAGQAGQDVAHVRADVAHDADHLDVEALGLGAGEDRQAVAALPALDLGERDRGQRARRDARGRGGAVQGATGPRGAVAAREAAGAASRAAAASRNAARPRHQTLGASCLFFSRGSTELLNEALGGKSSCS